MEKTNDRKYYRQLEQMYLSAPIQDLYPGIAMEVSNRTAVITLPTGSRYHHAGGGLHGSVFFRLLDDAGYFAAMSFEKGYFLLTKTFRIDLLRPHIEGELTATGRLVDEDNGRYRCEGVLPDKTGKVIAKGKGIFVKSRMPLRELLP